MTITFLLDLIGMAFLVAAALNGNFRRVSSLGAGLAVIAISHLILPAAV